MSGKAPTAIMSNSSFADWLKVSSCRLGVRMSNRFECRVSTAIGAESAGAPPRSTGTARTCVAASSDQSRASESTIRRSSKASRTCARWLGATRWPTMSRKNSVAAPAGRVSAVATKSPSAGRRPDHDVGGRQIREELGVGEEQVKPLDVGGRCVTVRLDQIAQRRHRSRLARRGIGPICVPHKAELSTYYEVVGFGTARRGCIARYR